MSRDPTQERIEEYLDGSLSPAERETVESRIAADPALAAELSACRRLRRLALACPPPPEPEGLAAAVRARLEEKMRPRRPRLPFRLATLGSAAAAALILVFFLNQGRLPPPAALPIPVPIAVTGPADRFALAPDHLADWLDQARNAAPGDLALLAAEARELSLLAGVRNRLSGTRGRKRGFLLAAEALLIQLENDPSAEALAREAMLVARAR